MTDLSDIHVAETTPMPVRHPATGAPLLTNAGDPMSIDLAGRDSPAYRAQLAKFQKAQASRRKAATPEELEEHTIATLVACTHGWTLQIDGALLPFSPKAARELYESTRWLKEQVDEWIADRANYLGESFAA